MIEWFFHLLETSKWMSFAELFDNICYLIDVLVLTNHFVCVKCIFNLTRNFEVWCFGNEFVLATRSIKRTTKSIAEIATQHPRMVCEVNLVDNEDGVVELCLMTIAEINEVAFVWSVPGLLAFFLPVFHNLFPSCFANIDGASV